jgi:hypothetical protein
VRWYPAIVLPVSVSVVIEWPSYSISEEAAS